MTYLRSTAADRFWGNVLQGPERACWPWQKAKTGKGYGLVRYNGRLMRAHRVAWALSNGVAPSAMPPDVEVHHLNNCNSNDCCNPHHLQALDSQTHDRIHATDLARRIK